MASCDVARMISSEPGDFMDSSGCWIETSSTPLRIGYCLYLHGHGGFLFHDNVSVGLKSAKHRHNCALDAVVYRVNWISIVQMQDRLWLFCNLPHAIGSSGNWRPLIFLLNRVVRKNGPPLIAD